MIRIEHLKKAYHNVEPIKDINCVINKGDVISIIGPSGTGKSTLLRMINMLETPTAGHIYVDDIDITEKNVPLNKLRQKVGMVFQSFNLFPHKTIIENVMMAPIDLKKIPKKDAYDNAMRLLRTVGLADKAMSYPDELSGGQKQRVAIARTLAMEPEVILFDEPTSALDPTMVLEVEKVIKQLAKENYTMLIVTHEMKFAKSISSRVFYLDEGTIYEEGTAQQIFDNPQKKKTQDFIRKQKTYSVNINDKNFDFLSEEENLEQFCRNQNMPYHMINNIQLAFEEICIVNILKNEKMNEDIKMMIGIEYFMENSETRMGIKYNGPRYDASIEGDDISKNIIKNIAKEITYEEIDEENYTNKIIMSFE